MNMNISSIDINYLFNPYNVTLLQFIGLILFNKLNVKLMNDLIFYILKNYQFSFLGSRVPTPITKGLEHLEFVDFAYLTINSIIEVSFISHLFLLIFSLPSDFTIYSILFKSIPTVYILFLFDDFFYYFWHRFMHFPFIYPYIHKHHHRQALPFRGYIDGANTTPMEHSSGLLCVWIAINCTKYVIGLDMISMMIFFIVYAVLALLNHTPYDVKFPEILGYFFFIYIIYYYLLFIIYLLF
jgi:sterol desaturase/sphingolipid hydroxylase (fatty acid hydroxylase superfamily)